MMRTRIRMLTNHLFTGSTYVAIGILVLALIFILIPILKKGAGAVVFRQTVEFRRMQLDLFARGDYQEITDAYNEAGSHRQQVYDLLDSFASGTELDKNVSLAKDYYRIIRRRVRDFEDSGQLDHSKGRDLQRNAKQVRELIIEAIEEENNLELVAEKLNEAITLASDQKLAELDEGRFAALAKKYLKNINNISSEQLKLRRQQLPEIRTLVTELFGPRPGSPAPALAQNRFGATRWDMAKKVQDKLLWDTKWVSQGEGKQLKAEKVDRIALYKGTDMEKMLILIRDGMEDMLQPKLTFYWRYFLDDSTPGHYFGGVGPEILGTLLIVVMTMLPAIPLGIGAGAYLAGRKRGGIVGALRICIDTLAGVPSIAFGLFGLAFFINWLQPALGLPKSAGIFAGGMTMSLLVLPVIIRASEEAIRSVPSGYVEGAMALGAGRAKTFWTITLPAAMPGILTGIILSVGRAAGETAPLLFTAAAAIAPLPKGLFEPVKTLSFGCYDIAVGDRLSSLVPHQQFGMVATLVLLVLGLNAVAIVLRRRITRKLSGR